MSEKQQSPEYAKISNATAISLGLMPGRMYRGAVNKCVNLLVHYPEGCSANCAYCGLAKKRPGSYREKSFIHVAWPVFSMDQIIKAISKAPSYVRRTCISMITNGKCTGHTIQMAERLKHETPLSVSILINPTIVDSADLRAMQKGGADKIGVAIDLATKDLFDKYRGKGVSGPHRWEQYWETLDVGLKVFGKGNVGAHLMVGMGETEKEMVSIMDKLWGMGVVNHLFSFFAEDGSRLGDRPQPPWSAYLRIQLARYLIENKLSRFEEMAFDPGGAIIDFGLSRDSVEEVIGSGLPFVTTGCTGPDGEVACNRPFGNCFPDERQWNYPYDPNKKEMDLIRRDIFEP